MIIIIFLKYEPGVDLGQCLGHMFGKRKNKNDYYYSFKTWLGGW